MNDKVVRRLTFNFTDASDNGVIDDVDARTLNLNSSERISMPQDVELVEPPRKNQRQQSLIPGIGPLIDMIFAVSSIDIHFCDIFQFPNFCFIDTHRCVANR